MLFFYLISSTDMSYHGNVVLFILLLNHVTEESGYNCSDFKSAYGSKCHLEECPPAKFMLKDNLVECYDNCTKSNNDDIGKECLSFISDTKYNFLNYLFILMYVSIFFVLVSTGFVFGIMIFNLCLITKSQIQFSSKSILVLESTGC